MGCPACCTDAGSKENIVKLLSPRNSFKLDAVADIQVVAPPLDQVVAAPPMVVGKPAVTPSCASTPCAAKNEHSGQNEVVREDSSRIKLLPSAFESVFDTMNSASVFDTTTS